MDTFTTKVDSTVLTESIKQRMASFEKFLKQYFKKVAVIHAEDYKYHSSGLIDQAVCGEKLDKLFRETSYKFSHDESGILYEYQAVDHYGVYTEPRIYQVQKSKLRVV